MTQGPTSRVNDWMVAPRLTSIGPPLASSTTMRLDRRARARCRPGCGPIVSRRGPSSARSVRPSDGHVRGEELRQVADEVPDLVEPASCRPRRASPGPANDSRRAAIAQDVVRASASSRQREPPPACPSQLHASASRGSRVEAHGATRVHQDAAGRDGSVTGTTRRPVRRNRRGAARRQTRASVRPSAISQRCLTSSAPARSSQHGRVSANGWKSLATASSTKTRSHSRSLTRAGSAASSCLRSAACSVVVTSVRPSCVTTTRSETPYSTTSLPSA